MTGVPSYPLIPVLMLSKQKTAPASHSGNEASAARIAAKTEGSVELKTYNICLKPVGSMCWNSGVPGGSRSGSVNVMSKAQLRVGAP